LAIRAVLSPSDAQIGLEKSAGPVPTYCAAVRLQLRTN